MLELERLQSVKVDSEVKADQNEEEDDEGLFGDEDEMPVIVNQEEGMLKGLTLNNDRDSQDEESDDEFEEEEQEEI